MDSSSTYTLAQTVTRVGHYQWIEQRLFELCGRWVTEIGDAEATFLVGTQSFHHSFLAEQWSRRLPQLGGEAEVVVTAPNDGVEQLLSVEWWADRPDVAKLVGLYRILMPRMAATYEEHRSKTSEVADGQTERVLDLCLRDYHPDWTAGEFLLQKIVVSDAQIEQSVDILRDAARHLLPGRGLLATGT